MSVTFVHLRIHSEFSIVDGIVRLPALMNEVVEQGVPAVALSDQSNLFAAVKFFKAATKRGVKPIIGCDVCLENPEAPDTPFALLLLCQNQQGYQNLTRLVSMSYRQGQTNVGPIIKRSWLIEMNEGLLVLSGAEHGDVGCALLQGNQALAEERLQFWQQHLPQRYYIEVQRLGHGAQERYIQAAVKLAQQYELPVVATNNVRFLNADDYDAHEARVCIYNGDTLNDPRRQRNTSKEQYLKTPKEMATLFADIPQALENTVQIAKRCNVKLELGKPCLPNYPTPANQSVESYLQAQSQQGLLARLQAIFDSEDPTQHERFPSYQQRLDIELEVINSMGFAGYFLIVADFVQWAKQNDIPVGPGRGSGAGSIVAYALGITDLDPLQYALLFERFLNPERVSMPDFDIDFCMEGRDRVIDYVAQKYGRDSVSQIITYGTMAAKAVVRDVGRVLGHPYGFVDKLAKLIPFELGITLDKALAQEDELRQRYEREEDVQVLIDLARKLEGVTRNAGKHAGGVVIAPSLLTDFAPLYCEPGGDNLVTQFDKDDVEAVGLVKFDFLGLRTLTIIKWALRIINKRRQQQQQAPLDITRIPLDDDATFTLLNNCRTTAVFQLESRGMKDLIKRLQPDCFEEIIALVALFRPGPLQSGMVDDFIDRKHGRAAVAYPHADLTPILKPTYGVILYQEQVMQIPQVLAGYTLGGADILRRAMGKKKPEEMAKQRSIFTQGATERGVDEEVATAIFDLMEKFAGYGFNKSHSAAYALVSYQTAWLKTHYPAPFMAAVLSSDMDNTDKVVGFISECHAIGLTVLPPHVNHSQYQFTVTDDATIVYGLGAVKGVGEAAIESVIKAREAEGPFKHIFDFCQRVELRKVNKRVLEALIRSGAFDDLGADRATLMASLRNALRNAEQQGHAQQWGQSDLFAEQTQSDELPIEYTAVAPWTDEERLLGERETLGYYFSGHPLDRYQEEFSHLTQGTLASLGPNGDKTVVVAGIVMGIRRLMTKRGKRMAIVSIEDMTGGIDITLFAETYDNYRPILEKDALLLIQGTVEVDDYSGGLRMRADSIWTLTEARTHFVKYLRLTLDAQQTNSDVIEQLKRQLQPFRQGQCPVCVEYHQEKATAKVLFGQTWWVQPSDQLLQNLQQQFGEEQVAFVYE